MRHFTSAVDGTLKGVPLSVVGAVADVGLSVLTSLDALYLEKNGDSVGLRD